MRDRASRQALELDALEADLAERDREIEEIIQALELKESEHARAVERHEAARREDDDEAAKQDEGAKDVRLLILALLPILLTWWGSTDNRRADARTRDEAERRPVRRRGPQSPSLRARLRSFSVLSHHPKFNLSAQLQLQYSSASVTITALTTRATTAERRLLATQAQLTLLERALADARTKVAGAEANWEARFRELQTRLLAAEEGLRRERQGARARLAELAATIA